LIILAGVSQTTPTEAIQSQAVLDAVIEDYEDGEQQNPHS
jgi:hypothetical protein